jgi:hypothetical protein
MSRAFAKRQPIVILDEQTGRRQLIWSELDANATSPQSADLLIQASRPSAGIRSADRRS